MLRFLILAVLIGCGKDDPAPTVQPLNAPQVETESPPQTEEEAPQSNPVTLDIPPPATDPVKTPSPVVAAAPAYDVALVASKKAELDALILDSVNTIRAWEIGDYFLDISETDREKWRRDPPITFYENMVTFLTGGSGVGVGGFPNFNDTRYQCGDSVSYHKHSKWHRFKDGTQTYFEATLHWHGPAGPTLRLSYAKLVWRTTGDAVDQTHEVTAVCAP